MFSGPGAARPASSPLFSAAAAAATSATPTQEPQIGLNPSATVTPTPLAATPKPSGLAGRPVARGHAPDLDAVNERLREGDLDPRIEAQLRGQLALASSFQIVDDDVTRGRRLPNQITRKDFERMAGIYGDITTGNSRLQFDDAAMAQSGMSKEAIDAFRAGAMSDIANLMQTETGRALLTGLNAGPEGHTTRLGQSLVPGTAIPFPGGARVHGPDAQGRILPDGTPLPQGAFSGGTDSIVQYVPVEPARPPAGQCPPWAPVRSDVTLLHELVHALHYAQGTLTEGDIEPSEAVHPADVGQYRCEYQAVGVGADEDLRLTENRYRAERARMAGEGAVGLREGDAGMPRRDFYSLPATPSRSGPPQPAAASSAALLAMPPP